MGMDRGIAKNAIGGLDEILSNRPVDSTAFNFSLFIEFSRTAVELWA
jgi:hypothetical protein